MSVQRLSTYRPLSPPFCLDPELGPQYFCKFEGENFDLDEGLDDKGRRVRTDETVFTLNLEYEKSDSLVSASTDDFTLSILKNKRM